MRFSAVSFAAEKQIEKGNFSHFNQFILKAGILKFFIEIIEGIAIFMYLHYYKLGVGLWI